MNAIDYCPSLLSKATDYQALGQAAGASIQAASQAVEQARYAATQAAAQAQLGSAVTWLRWAQTTYGGDNYWADRCACAAAQLATYASQVPAGGTQLATFQTDTLLPFQGVLAQLQADAANWGPVEDAALEVGVIVTAALAVLFLGGWAEARPVRRGTSAARGR